MWFALVQLTQYEYFLAILFAVVFFFGPIILAYASAVLVSKLFRKKKTLANLTRLVSWALLFPLLFSLSVSYYVYVTTDPWKPHQSISSMFFKNLVSEFVIYPTNVVLLIIWSIGVILMFRKELLQQLVDVKKESTKQKDNIVVSSH